MSMRRRASCCLAVALAAFAQAASAACDSLASLDWLLGEWVADGAKSTFRETWTALGPATWAGRGVETPKDDPSRASGEDLRLLEMGGGVFYVAKVGHNELPVAFRLRECEGGRWVFENPAHDFPRRLDYVRGPDGRLQVRVSDGADSGFTLDFARQPVPSEDVAAVFAAEDARLAAMVRGDPAILRPFLEDDLLYVHTTGEVEDREQLLAAIAEGRKRYLEVEPLERRVMFNGADSANVHGRVRMRVAAGERQLDFEARYLAIYVLRDGTWRLRAWQSLRLP
jgi:hypothetical protein